MYKNYHSGVNRKTINNSVNIVSAYDCVYYAPNRHIQNSYYPSYHCMIYTLSGSGKVIYSNGMQATLEDGTLFFSKFNNIKMLECVEGEWHFHIIWFQPNGFALPLNEKIKVDFPDAEEFIKDITKHINTPKRSHYVSDFNVFYANSKLLMRIADCLAIFNKQNPYYFKTKADEIINYIQENTHERLKIEDLAYRFKYSEKQLRRIILQKTGLLPKKYIESVKLKKACELLTCTDYTVDFISSSLGYPYATQFMKAFKAMYKTSPTEYRERHTPQLSIKE